MFGAWQAGAWAALAGRIDFDLVVGASVGALNGYAIACGASPEELRRLWLDPNFTRLKNVAAVVRSLMHRARPKMEFAVAVTELMRLKPRVFSGGQVRAEHLIASCAIPFVLRQVRIEGRYHSDGGLLNPLPVWAAVELGATQALALNALPRSPSRWLRPLVRGLRVAAGHRPPIPAEVEVWEVRPARDLGTLRSALAWDRERVERWLNQGQADIEAALADGRKKTFPF